MRNIINKYMQKGFSLLGILVLVVLASLMVGYTVLPPGTREGIFETLKIDRSENKEQTQDKPKGEEREQTEMQDDQQDTNTDVSNKQEEIQKKPISKEVAEAPNVLVAPFEISRPQQNDGTFLSPHKGEILIVGKTYTIRWKKFSESPTIQLEIHADLPSGGGDGGFPESIENDGSFTWTIPPSTGEYLGLKYSLTIRCGTDHTSACASDGGKPFRFSDTFFIARDGQELGIASKDFADWSEIKGPATAVEMGEFILDARAASETLKFPSMNLTIWADTSLLLHSCHLMEGSRVLTDPFDVFPAKKIAPPEKISYQFYFRTPLMIERGTYKTLVLKCDVSANEALQDNYWGGSVEWSVDIYGSNEVFGAKSGKKYKPYIYYTNAKRLNIDIPDKRPPDLATGFTGWKTYTNNQYGFEFQFIAKNEVNHFTEKQADNYSPLMLTFNAGGASPYSIIWNVYKRNSEEGTHWMNFFKEGGLTQYPYPPDTLDIGNKAYLKRDDENPFYPGGKAQYILLTDTSADIVVVVYFFSGTLVNSAIQEAYSIIATFRMK